MARILEYLYRRNKTFDERIAIYMVDSSEKISQPMGPHSTLVAVHKTGTSYADFFKMVRDGVGKDLAANIVSAKKGRGDEVQIRVRESPNKKSDIVQRIDKKIENVMITDNPLDRMMTMFNIKRMEIDIEEGDIVEAFRKLTGEQTPVKVSALRIAYGKTKRTTCKF